MKRTSKKGFTLMEMLIVIAIIAILIAIAIPVLKAQLDKAGLTTDQSNARSLKSLVAVNYMTYADNQSDANCIVKDTAAKFYLGTDGNTIKTSTSGAMQCKGNTGDTNNYQSTDSTYIWVQWSGSEVTSSNPKLP